MRISSMALVTVFVFAFIHPTHAAVPGGAALASLIAGQFDTNADDSIDNGEWESGVIGSFSDLDADSDGFIASDEIESLKSDIAGETGDIAAGILVVIIQKVLLTLDADGDDLVSREEYEDLAVGFFNKLDADENKTLSMAELADLPVRALKSED